MNDVTQVRDTILHEIAHALEPEDGHGPRRKDEIKNIEAVLASEAHP
jgi:hypothetical protein